MEEFSQPILMTWDGEALHPRSARWAAVCDQQLVVGQTYRVAEIKDRSTSSHSHYFAAVAEAHANLPEDQAERFQTADHLRKWCLIKTGWADQRQIVCASKAEAQRVAAFVRPMDEYAIVTATEAVVTVFTAKSQSYRAMGKKDFQKSKQDVLDLLASMIGVEPQQLSAEAGQAA